MPVNPLVRAGYKTAIQPDGNGHNQAARTPEQQEVWEDEHFVPYRGAVDHGLTHGSSVPSDLRKMGLDDPTEYVDDDVTYEQAQPITPIPVVIYREDEPGPELKMFRTSRGYAGTVTPQRLLSRNDGRSKAQVKNMGSAPIWIGHDQASASPVNGYRVDPGSEWSTSSDQEVWVIADPSASTQQDGWQNVVPRQTINGQQIISLPFDNKGRTAGRIYFRVYGISGTTPSITGIVTAAQPDGVTNSGVTLVSAGARTTVGSASASAAAFAPADRGLGRLDTTAGSADASYDAELWYYSAPANPAVDFVPLALSVEFSAVNPA